MARNYLDTSEYEYSDTTVVIMGRPVIGAIGVAYKIKRDKTLLPGAGKRAHGIQKGKKTFDGSLTLRQSEVIALDRAAQEKGYEDLTDIDFDIIVSYLKDGVLTTDRVVKASVTEYEKSFKDGDAHMEITLPFIALDVIPNVI